MKVDLTELELTYIANMLAAIIVSVKGFDKKTRKNLEKIRDRILPPRSYARLSQGDIKQILTFVDGGINVCTTQKTTEADADRLKNIESILVLLSGVKEKLSKGVAA